MAVVATERFSAWWNYQMQELAAGDVVPDGELADHLLATGAPVVEQTDTTPDVDSDGVPDSSVKDVLGWVGDDPARAGLALAAETGRDTPRKTLIAELEKLIAAAAAPAAPAAEASPEGPGPAVTDTPAPAGEGGQ
jgi:hypothetical protein